MRTDYPRHLPDFSYIGLQRYFLTFCTDPRAAVFLDASTVELVTEQLLRAARERQFALVAYCFMPDHVHLLVEGMAEGSDCLAFIKAFKQYSGYEYKKRCSRRLWQKYGYEHVLRKQEDSMDVARYILENPVRANLVEAPEDYPFMGSEVFDVRALLSGMDGEEWYE